MGDDITNLLAVLKKISIEQNYSNPDIKISPISTGGANYSSRLYLVKITSDGKADIQLFSKVAAIGEIMREQCNLEPYDCEHFMYTELLKIYRSLEEKYNLPEKHKLAVPKYYGADATRLQEILVLEDLSSQGFTLHNRLESVSWAYAATAITELAKFHALSLAFQRNNPEKFKTVANMFQHGVFTEHEGNKVFFNTSVKSAVAAVREEHKEKLLKFVDSMSLAKFSKLYEALRRPVLIHGDFRPSNMLHRFKKDGTLEVIAVDYQTIQAGCPVIDLLYFMFTATDGQFRARHYQQLVDHYYSELGAAVAKLGLKVEEEYSREDFEYELKEKLPFGLHLSVICLPIILIDEKAAPQLDDEMTMASLAIEASGDLYTRRLNEVVDDYVAWGVLA